MENGYVGLTFDDGPHVDSTLPLLAALADAQALATFFVCGQCVHRLPDLTRAVAGAGMQLGNHTYNHPHLPQIAPEEVVDEIERTQQAIVETCGETPVLFRPPFGETDDSIRAVAAGFGMHEVLWTVDPWDWSGVDAEKIVQDVAHVEPGGIILLHDGGYPGTLGAVPVILRALADRGLSTGRIVAAPPDHEGRAAVQVVAP